MTGTARAYAGSSSRAARLADRLAVGAAGRARRGGEHRHLEPGMAGERSQELLPGDTGGADDRDPPLAHARPSIRAPPSGVKPSLRTSVERRLASAREPGARRLEDLLRRAAADQHV